MERDYLIRCAKKEDAKGIYGVLLAAFEEFRHFYTPEGFNDTVMSEEAVIERMKEMKLYVAIDQTNTVIGTIGWQKVDDMEGHIRGMAVIPDRQGKNSPAKALLQIVEEDARSEGCTLLTLDTTAILERAQNFYIKCGFKKTGKTGDFFGSTIYEFAKEF
ncbi:MAG: GNAT family N-acetyltransferase [Promethearchaeota archaeon]